MCDSTNGSRRWTSWWMSLAGLQVKRLHNVWIHFEWFRAIHFEWFRAIQAHSLLPSVYKKLDFFIYTGQERMSLVQREMRSITLAPSTISVAAPYEFVPLSSYPLQCNVCKKHDEKVNLSTCHNAFHQFKQDAASGLYRSLCVGDRCV
jgi:hypothetical protein